MLAFTNDTVTADGQDLLVLAPGKSAPEPLVKSRFNEAAARFSPDGRWVAFVSDESGREEIYVQPYPGPGGKRQLSADAGGEPVWAPNGRELFYRAGDKMMTVPVTLQPAFTAAMPRLLFEGRFERPLASYPNYDVAPDGQRFLMLKDTTGAQPPQITVVLNWISEVGRRVPVKSGS